MTGQNDIRPLGNAVATIFTGKNADNKTEQALPWHDLAYGLANPEEYLSKLQCPWIKLATFGEKRTPKNSLRFNGNVISVTGVELDYDAGKVTVQEALFLLRLFGIKCVLYTSASHTPAVPRWRVVAPLSASYPPEMRAGLLARLDAVLGGIASPESYTLSQSYFFGRVTGAPFEAHIVEGNYLDMANLPEVDRPNRRKSGDDSAVTEYLPLPANIAEVLEKIDPMGDYQASWMPATLGTLNDFGPAAIPALVKWSMPYYDAEYPEFDESARVTAAKLDFEDRLQPPGFGLAGWGNVRELAGLPRNDAANLFNAASLTAQLTAPPTPKKVKLVSANDIQEEVIEWLWREWLARGKIHILAGAPGTGKTTLALLIAAIISRGGELPDGSTAPAGKVLIWTGEDGLADTIKPRLIASGANLDNIHFITEIEQNGEKVPFDPALHMADLQAAGEGLGDISLMIVDSIADAVGGDSHKNAEVRRGLRPLVTLAESLHCAVLGIAHFNKGSAGKDPLERVMGSAAFGAVARTVFACAKLVEDGNVRRVFCRAKSNIGPDDGGFDFRLDIKRIPGDIEASCAVWGEPLEGTARQILVNAEDEEKTTATGGKVKPIDGAKAFLMEVLSLGAWPSKRIQSDGKDFGFSWATLRRAKDALGIRANFFDDRWFWALPDHLVPSPQFSSVRVEGEKVESGPTAPEVPRWNGTLSEEV